MNILSTQQMITVGELFSDSVDFVLSSYAEESAAHINAFLVELIMREKAYMLVSTEGITHITKKVFTNEAIRDFIFSLQYTFFAKWGNHDVDYQGLVYNLSRGLTISNNKELNSIPKEINSRLYQVEEITTLLDSNKWLVIVLLIKLYVKIEPKPVRHS